MTHHLKKQDISDDVTFLMLYHRIIFVIQSDVVLHDHVHKITLYSNYNLGNRGSYMRAHVLLDLFNEVRKGDKMRVLSSIL